MSDKLEDNKMFKELREQVLNALPYTFISFEITAEEAGIDSIYFLAMAEHLKDEGLAEVLYILNETEYKSIASIPDYVYDNYEADIKFKRNVSE